MAKQKTEYIELGREKVSDTTWVVVSTVARDGEIVGININNYVVSPKYTGYSPATFIPNAHIAAFAKIVNSIV